MRYYTPSVTPNLKKHSDPYSYVLMFCDKIVLVSMRTVELSVVWNILYPENGPESRSVSFERMINQLAWSIIWLSENSKSDGPPAWGR